MFKPMCGLSVKKGGEGWFIYKKAELGAIKGNEWVL